MSQQMPQALARITPAQMPASVPALSGTTTRVPTKREKAAIIVRLLMAQGSDLPISNLPEHMQASLTEKMGQMRFVDRSTMAAVVDEFLAELGEIGMTFPGDINAALDMMDGRISPSAANRIRRLAGDSSKIDPWERLTELPIERLLPIIEVESNEVAAVMLSKLPIQKAADILGQIPGGRARKVAYTVSITNNIHPETVRRIGLSLVAQLESVPVKAFESDPIDRVGEILNVVPSATRDDVLDGLESEDAEFAEQVRKTIFTFIHIPERIIERDLPRIMRAVPQPVLVTALTAAKVDPKTTSVVDYFFENISQRLSESLQEEMAERGKVSLRDAEAAMAEIIGAIRAMESSGDITFRQKEEAE